MQPPSPVVQQSPNQYDFIVNYGKSQSNNWLVNAPLKTRLLVAGVGAVILLLIVWVGIALLTGSGNTDVSNVVILAEEQTELSRISQDPVANATQESTQNLAVTIQLSLSSDQQAFVSYLTGFGAAPSPQVLATKQNKQTDAQLAAAKTAGTYDQTYISVAQQELTSYAKGLKQAYNASTDAKGRQLLNSAYEHAQLLLDMVNQT